jgi:hypothetical protein
MLKFLLGTAAVGAGVVGVRWLLGQREPASAAVADAAPGAADASPDPSPDAAPTPNAGSYGPPPVGDPRWGSVPAEAQQLLLRAEALTGVPGAAVFLGVVGQGEGNWAYLRGREFWDARNTRANEVSASQRAYDAGLASGRPAPTFPEVRDFGSGGAFGALAPYVAWAGFTQGETPLLTERPEVIFRPYVSVAHAAWYLTRLLRPPYSPATWAQVRLGWASPSALRTEREGKLSVEVLGRMIAAATQAGLTDATKDVPPPPARASAITLDTLLTELRG